jgi:hypothetical protein
VADVLLDRYEEATAGGLERGGGTGQRRDLRVSVR